MQLVATECRRVLKPGGHALVWSLPRTSHWTATAWENAGFEPRDRIAHCFGSGFPKSADISKMLDKASGAEREVVGLSPHSANKTSGSWQADDRPSTGMQRGNEGERTITAPATEAAKQWQGWGTALKPAIEDWWLFRKPLDGTVAANVLKHGTGAINVDGCRVEVEESDANHRYNDVKDNTGKAWSGKRTQPHGVTSHGRWPANLIHDGSDEVLELFPVTKNGGKLNAERVNKGSGGESTGNIYGVYKPHKTVETYGGDTGSAARFFYCAKASKKDRDEGLDAFEPRKASLKYQGGDGLAGRTQVDGQWVNTDKANRRDPRNHHPTVKPVSLMTYLCRLITPPNGIILDPFMGSGSTGKAAMLEGFRFIGIEREPEYFAIACKRIEHTQHQSQLGLEAVA